MTTTARSTGESGAEAEAAQNAGPAAAAAPVPTADEAAAAGLRALRAALAHLGRDLGYGAGGAYSQNQVLLELGADRADVETMRQFLHAHQPGSSPAGSSQP